MPEEVHEGDGRGEWDADRLAQVLTNLLSNALTYGEPGTVVRVVTRGEDGAVILQVHNLGEPIPLESLPRSIGLGLFIVDRIVRAHGGTVAVHSRPSTAPPSACDFRGFRMRRLEGGHAAA